ncbi:hypothetical protein NEOLEDRAFT_1074592 [Neolentinus lepideus HHB14362 ss-1]|uniref:Uncharacterized protein n=1 Tax=Neolentinus lepideus HHB14362 ss-1 TaxID=1314782 RepID=A0A165PE50_9AGAM|nr:hypothetical protein NEOLEDRAFT_1074592 [Neolentinus lepideus HHB14362 ss-1]
MATLPFTIPYNSNFPPFSLDSEDIEDMGYSGALNQCFHHVWSYKAQGIHIHERGTKLDYTLLVFKIAISCADDYGIIDNWLDAFLS